MEIINTLKKIREDRKISRKKVASQLNVSESLINEVESGRTRLSLDFFLKLCDIYEINPIELLKNNSQNYIILDQKDIGELNRIVNKINKQIITNNDNSNYFSTGDIQIGNNNNNIAIGNNTNIKNSFNKK